MQAAQKPLKQIASYLMFDVVLDQNASGTVYKARHKDSAECCLIKVITKERLKQDPGFLERSSSTMTEPPADNRGIGWPITGSQPVLVPQESSKWPAKRAAAPQAAKNTRRNSRRRR